MIAHQKFFYVSPEDYLEGESVSPIKHEYRKGQILAMSGAKRPHIIIVSNLNVLLGNHLQNTNCLVLVSDIKVNIDQGNYYYYPDVAVTCDQREINGTDEFILYPTLIIEVLSKSTAKFDRGEKFTDYQLLDSLQEYVLVSQTNMAVECWRKNPDGQWELQVYGRGDMVEFQSVQWQGAIELIYQKVPEINAN